VGSTSATFYRKIGYSGRYLAGVDAGNRAAGGLFRSTVSLLAWTSKGGGGGPPMRLQNWRRERRLSLGVGGLRERIGDSESARRQGVIDSPGGGALEGQVGGKLLPHFLLTWGGG